MPSRHTDGRIIVKTLTTGGIFQEIIDGNMRVERGVLQNISDEAITLVTYEGGTQGQGIILGPASAAGQAGGSLAIEKVDLGRWRFTRSSAGVCLSIYIEGEK